MDATFQAIESLVQSGTELLLYSVNNVTEGTDSQGEVTVRLAKSGRIVNGMGADTDIVVASAKAYMNALNKLGAQVAREPAVRRGRGDGLRRQRRRAARGPPFDEARSARLQPCFAITLSLMPVVHGVAG